MFQGSWVKLALGFSRVDLTRKAVFIGKDLEQILSPLPLQGLQLPQPGASNMSLTISVNDTILPSAQEEILGIILNTPHTLHILWALPSKYIQNLTNSHPSPPIHTPVQTPRFLHQPLNSLLCFHPYCPAVYSYATTSDLC